MADTSQIQLVVHHDDLGASHGANLAFVELSDLGVVTSGSVMVPCPWFPEIAAYAKNHHRSLSVFFVSITIYCTRHR